MARLPKPFRLSRGLARANAAVPGQILCTLLLASGCGIEIGNPKKPKDGQTTSPDAYLVDDQSVESGLLASQVDQSLASTVEEAHTVAGGASLAFFGLTAVPTVAAMDVPTTTKCTPVSARSASVVRTRTGSIDHSFQNASGTNEYKASMLNQTQTTVWTSPSNDLPCTADQSAVTLDWTKAAGLSLTQQFLDSETMTITRQRAGQALSRTSASLKQGTRQATWQITATSPQLTLTKVVQTQFTDSLTITRHDGTTVTVDTTVASDATAPLTYQVVRDKTTQAWISKTLVSGTVLTTLGSDSRVQATYAGLTLTVAGGCVPQSGTINGQIFHGADQTPSRTFQVTFDGLSGHVTYDDGTTDSYVPGYCDLDDGSGAAAPSPID